MREKLLGPQHRDLAAVLCNLGEGSIELGEYDKARQYYARAYEIERAALGEDHSSLAYSMVGLGRIAVATGKPEEGHRQLMAAARLREHTLGPDHPLLAKSLCALASAARATGRIEEARAFQQRSSQIYRARGSATGIGRSESEGWDRRPGTSASADGFCSSKRRY
jgi:tetratricopeptide (TPR) repeat protein